MISGEMRVYRHFGLRVESDLPLPQLAPLRGDETATVTLARADGMLAPPEGATQLGPFLWAGRGALYLSVPGILDLQVEQGHRILYAPAPGSDDDSLRLFLLGSGMGALMMQRGFLVLHGNAIDLDGTGVICLGPSGVGKSTIAAGMQQRGYRIVADDLCPIDDAGRVIPGVPRIKLWQDSADRLGLATGGLDRVRPDLAKYHLPLGAAHRDTPLPVDRIYVLNPHNEDTIRTEPVTGPDKFMVLRENTYRRRYLDGLALSPVHFRQVAELARRVRVTRVFRPTGGFAIDRLLDVLAADAGGAAR
jgi:hypothetical protein